MFATTVCLYVFSFFSALIFVIVVLICPVVSWRSAVAGEGRLSELSSRQLVADKYFETF